MIFNLFKKKKPAEPVGAIRAALRGKPTFLKAHYTAQRVYIIRGEQYAVKIQFEANALHIVIYRSLSDLKLDWIGKNFTSISQVQFDIETAAEKYLFDDVIQFLTGSMQRP